MSIKRRRFLKHTASMAAVGAGASLLTKAALAKRPMDGFDAKNLSEALSTLYGDSAPMESADIKIKAPDIAENGAVVPVTVSFNVPGAQTLDIIVEKNPQPLAASFKLNAGAGGKISTRLKMGKTSKVHAVIKAGDKVHSAAKEVKVTIGGCGG